MPCSPSSGNLAIRSRLCLSPLMPLRLLDCVLVSRAAASALFLFRLAFAIALSRHRWYSPRSSYRRAGRACRVVLCLLAAVGSFVSVSSLPSVCPFLSCWHPRRQSVGMLNASACFVPVVSPYRPRPVPRAVWLLVSLLFVIRPVLRHGRRGDALRCVVLVWARRLCRCLPSLGAGCRVRLACYHFGVFSPWWCVVWVVCIGRLLVRCGVAVRIPPRACSSSVIRLMWLIVSSGGGFFCCPPVPACLPVPSARCRCMPVMLRYAFRPARRVGERGGLDLRASLSW